MTDSKPDVLVVNNFHPPTISRIDKIYQTYHLWKLNTKAQNELIAKLDGKCKAAVTGSWTLIFFCEIYIYPVNPDSKCRDE